MSKTGFLGRANAVILFAAALVGAACSDDLSNGTPARSGTGGTGTSGTGTSGTGTSGATVGAGGATNTDVGSGGAPSTGGARTRRAAGGKFGRHARAQPCR